MELLFLSGLLFVIRLTVFPQFLGEFRTVPPSSLDSGALSRSPLPPPWPTKRFLPSSRGGPRSIKTRAEWTAGHSIFSRSFYPGTRFNRNEVRSPSALLSPEFRIISAAGLPFLSLTSCFYSGLSPRRSFPGEDSSSSG